MNVSEADRISPGDPALAAALRRDVRGEVLFSRADRGRYATDASIYQVEPLGVVVPRTRDDLQATLAIAREHGVPVLPRGGGTSQCGQTVNRAIVLDCSKHLRDIVEVDRAACTALVEPGLVLGHLNAALKKDGLFFPVDPSTHQRCTIGGMAGNNSCGAKSIRYGLMADNVLAIDALLADGTRHRFGQNAQEPAALLAALRALGVREADEIAARFPRQLRRVGGYAIDALTPQAQAAGRGNLARLLVGSEGTLAISERLLLKLAPIKPRKVVGICQFPTFRAAMEATRHLVTLDPEAVELVDRTMIDLGRGIAIYKPTIERMLIGEPQSLLLVEFHGDDDGALAKSLDRLDQLMGDIGHPHAVVRATDPRFQADIAEVREAGLNIMMSEKSAGKPISFIEDCAVDLDDLADYTERLNAVFARHGTRPTYYAHASVGCLHVRPVLDMKRGDDVRAMRAIAEECFALVREYKGSHSGEHGDGIARSEFNEPMFGGRLARAFEEVKDAFDPAGLLNPGRIVRAPHFDDRSLFRYTPNYRALDVTPALDWSAWPGPQGGLLGAVEMCNNNGTCRKFDAGAMCPSYRITRDETHLTRGRANTLRLALTGQLGTDGLASDDVAAALKLCVSCKACKRECPTGVDMARLKIEAGAARAAKHGVAWRERLVAELPRLAPWASRAAPLSNLRNASPLLRRLGERTLGLAASRPLPTFRRDAFRETEIDAPTGAADEVILFADTFNRWFEPENLRAGVRVLRRLGLRPVAPRGGRPLCCGRTYLSAGMVDRARAEARRMLAALAGGTAPIVGLEPSCLTTLRDEIPALLPGPEAAGLAKRARLFGELVVEHGDAAKGRLARAGTALVHGHCHQKAFGAFPAGLDALRLVDGLDVTPIESSCCGMAGAFGYGAETLDASKAMAELSLLPAVRAAAPDALIVADGTSCRHQIADLAGREALHSARVLDMTAAPSPRPLDTSSPAWHLAAMSDLVALEAETLAAIAAASDETTLDQARVAALGKKGAISALLATLGKMAPDERKARGAEINLLKDKAVAAFDARRETLRAAALEARLAAETVDVTLLVRPGPLEVGRIHPITQVMDELSVIFADMGFSIAEGPDIESDDYNFTKLNFPPDHPAREMHDTFFFPAGPDGTRKLLRTHTSPVQVRTMLGQTPPIRVICPGRTYRCDSDQTHTPMFHQVEGLVIDRSADLGNLKWVLEEFLKAFFEVESVKMRFRPSYFPFTEPSMEVDIQCARRDGEIRFGEGEDWLEILGCGMVHPNVLRNCGIDPDVYQGFAWGIGIDRIAMLKYGMPDLRAFFESDVRWLRHYGFKPLDVPSLVGGLT